LFCTRLIRGNIGSNTYIGSRSKSIDNILRVSERCCKEYYR